MHKQSHQNTNPTFTYRKGRIFYFSRKVPSDLHCHYKRPVFVQSLRTTSRSSAQKAATILSARLDEQWLMLRIKHNQSPASQLLVEAEYKSELPLISEILARYLDTKWSVRACGVCLGAECGDRGRLETQIILALASPSKNRARYLFHGCERHV